MYARVVTAKARQGESREEAGAMLRERAVPVMRQQPGFRGVYWLWDPQTGEGMTVLLWDDQQAAEAGERALEPIRERTMKERGVTMLGVRGYEVIANA